MCAESDADRDSWVEVLVRYVSGSYNDDPMPGLVSNSSNDLSNPGGPVPRTSTSSAPPSYDNENSPFNSRRPGGRPSRDELSKGPSLQSNQVGPAPPYEDNLESSPVRISPIDRQGPGGFSDTQVAKKLLDRSQQPADAPPLSSSLPTSSPLDNANGVLVGISQRANSELGHYPDMVGKGRHQHDQSLEYLRKRDHLNAADARAPSPDVNGKSKISGPIGGAPIPPGYKFGAKDAPADSAAVVAANDRRDKAKSRSLADSASVAAANDRREKAKSRSFWGFGRPNGGKHFVTPDHFCTLLICCG